MAFNWIKFLRHYSIEYVESGPNVARGNANVRCPWCGPADPSHHLGINLSTGAWGCWRLKSHRGRRPHRLVMILLGCSFQEANKLVGMKSPLPMSEFDQFVDKLKKTNDSETESEERELVFPSQFFPLADNLGRTFGQRFASYLVTERKFHEDDILKVASQYDLHYCLTGVWKYRIIFPIRYSKKLVCWVGRSILANSTVRYQALANDPDVDTGKGNPRALVNIKSTIFNFDTLWNVGGRILIINEGPFDALKLDFYSKDAGVRATCLFGVSVSDNQLWQLHRLATRFDKMVLMLDANAPGFGLNTLEELVTINASIQQTPFGVKDPADLTKSQVLKYIDNCLN